MKMFDSMIFVFFFFKLNYKIESISINKTKAWGMKNKKLISSL